MLGRFFEFLFVNVNCSCSAIIFLHGEIKIFNFNSHRTSYGHLKVWSKIDKIDLSGIAT